MKRKADSAMRAISPPPSAKRPPSSSKPPSAGSFSKGSFLKFTAVAAFFTPTTQKKESGKKMEWQVRHESLIVGKYRAKDIRPNPSKVAAFDLVYSIGSRY